MRRSRSRSRSFDESAPQPVYLVNPPHSVSANSDFVYSERDPEPTPGEMGAYLKGVKVVHKVPSEHASTYRGIHLISCKDDQLIRFIISRSSSSSQSASISTISLLEHFLIQFLSYLVKVAFNNGMKSVNLGSNFHTFILNLAIQ